MFPVYRRLWADPDYRRDAEALLGYAADHDVGVMAIKAAAAAPGPAVPRTADTWYEPWTDPDAVARGVRFALSTPGVHAFCTPGDTRVLTSALTAAVAFTPLTTDERAAAVARHGHGVVDLPDDPGLIRVGVASGDGWV